MLVGPIMINRQICELSRNRCRADYMFAMSARSLEINIGPITICHLLRRITDKSMLGRSKFLYIGPMFQNRCRPSNDFSAMPSPRRNRHSPDSIPMPTCYLGRDYLFFGKIRSRSLTLIHNFKITICKCYS